MQYAGLQTFAGGQDSFILPINLNDNQYAAAENIVNRGGIVSTRPDSKTLFCCPTNAMPQGCTLFTPSNGIPYLVFACYGRVYVSPKPFRVFTQLANIHFSPQSKQLAWSVCQQSTDYDPSGNLVFLPKPVQVLIMQDNNTRAAMWDGTTARHLNPTYSGTPDKTVTGMDETLIGLWMIWSNNRLWVSRGNEVFSSDIGNPLKFTEAQYLNEGRAFYLPGDCTGMAETTDRQGIICFTANEGIFIKSSVQDRTQWLSLADGVMQNTIFPNTGCLSHRSIVTQNGLLWWFSQHGLTNLNAAARQNISSKLELQDQKMFASKYFVGSNLSSICGTSRENYLLESVPSGDKLNRHTWILDQNPASDPTSSVYDASFTNAWASTWTGWRPVEWAKGQVDGRERIFFQSVDFDGNVRMWEAFTGSTGKDNLVPITAWVQTKEHNFQNLDRKKFRWAEFAIKEALGTFSLLIAYAGRRGAFTTIFTGDLCANRGQIYYGTTYGDGVTNPLLRGNRAQTRLFRTQDTIPPNACNACGVESTDPNNIDTQFSLLFVWSGKMGVEWYRIASIEDPKQEGGDAGCVVENCETNPRSLAENGCTANSKFTTTSPFPLYTSTQTYSVEVAPYTYTATKTATSIISQADADLKAFCSAKSEVFFESGLTP